MTLVQVGVGGLSVRVGRHQPLGELDSQSFREPYNKEHSQSHFAMASGQHKIAFRNFELALVILSIVGIILGWLGPWGIVFWALIGVYAFVGRSTRMNSAPPRSPPFGWLILGICSGLVAGHAVAVLSYIPPGYVSRMLDVVYASMLEGAVVGIFVGAALERLARWVPIWQVWLFLAVVSVAYYMMLAMPAFNAVR